MLPMPQCAPEILAALIRRESQSLLAQWRTQVRQLPSAEHLDTPTLTDHLPGFLEDLARALLIASDKTIPEALLQGSPPAHGLQRYADGYDIVEVVAEYNILRGCIHDLADRNAVSLRGQCFHILNRVFDEAISLAVQTFATGQALEVQRRRDEYLAFVAHDLRTPLSAIALAARVLGVPSRGPGDDARAARMLHTLSRNVRQLEVLVDNVLKESAHVATDEGMQLACRTFDLWPLAESLMGDLAPVADTGGTSLVNAIPEELEAFADANALRRVLQNLVANAITHSPRGTVTIAARSLDRSGAVECTVSDNGVGIADDRLATLFDQPAGDALSETGTGLGLSIARSFVEAHGGALTVESTVGKGATFRFNLPAREPPRQ